MNLSNQKKSDIEEVGSPLDEGKLFELWQVAPAKRMVSFLRREN